MLYITVNFYPTV